MKTAIERLSFWLVRVGSVAIFIMMIVMVGDAILRKIVRPFPGAYETSLGLLVLIMYLPQGYVQLRRAHVSVDILSKRLPPKMSSIIQFVGALMGAGVFGLLTYLSFTKAWDSTLSGESWSGIVNYPVWPFRWIVPLGLGVFVMQLLDTAIDTFSKALRKESR